MRGRSDTERKRAPTALQIYLTQQGASALGTALSEGALSGAPFNAPLRGNYMEKFKAQSWQLVVHITMACVGWHAVRGRTWLSDPASVFEPMGPAPHFDMLDPVPAVKALYIAQIASARSPRGLPSFVLHCFARAHILTDRRLAMCPAAVWMFTLLSHAFVFEKQKDYYLM